MTVITGVSRALSLQMIADRGRGQADENKVRRECHASGPLKEANKVRRECQASGPLKEACSGKVHVANRQCQRGGTSNRRSRHLLLPAVTFAGWALNCINMIGVWVCARVCVCVCVGGGGGDLFLLTWIVQILMRREQRSDDGVLAGECG